MVLLRRNLAWLVAAMVLAGAAGFAVGWNSPSQFRAETVLFARRIAPTEPSTAELRDLLEDIEVAANLPGVGDQIEAASGARRGADYSLRVEQVDGTDGVVRFVVDAIDPDAARYVSRNAPALVVALLTDQQIARNQTDLAAANIEIDEAVTLGAAGGTFNSALADAAAAARIGEAGAISARVAFDAGGLTASTGSLERLSPWGLALWRAAVAAVGTLIAAVVLFWLVDLTSGGGRETADAGGHRLVGAR